MESDIDTDEVRQKALHLAAEVAETDDSNVLPVLLLGLKEILERCPPNSELGSIIRIDLWTYDIIHVCNLALKQDFSVITGKWSTAASLSVLLCQCCVGLELPEVQEYKDTFLLDVLEGVLVVATKIQDQYHKTELGEDKRFYMQNFQSVISGLQLLMASHPHLAPIFIQSKRLLQIMMVEDVEVSLLVMTILENMLKTDRYILQQLSQGALNSLLDEIIFKLSSSDDTSIGRTATQLILTATNYNPSVVNILLSKRYRGVKAYLSKWRGRGFDNDVKRLVRLLEAGTAAQAEQMKFATAATTIQCWFRGYRSRKQLEQANRGITKLQRVFREKQFERKRASETKREEEGRKLVAEQKRIHGFRSSMRKQLQMLESAPAREVNKLMEENQITAVTRIQATFRGMRARKKAQGVRQQMMRVRAAIRIQRQFRRYRNRKEQNQPFPIPPGLTDARRVEIQNAIMGYREKFPPKHRTTAELKDLHEKSYNLLANHLMLTMKTRKNEQKREALLARLKMDSDQLLAAPKLLTATPEVIDNFTSRTAPIIAKAQLNHSEEMRKQRQPWWKKLWDDDTSHDRKSHADDDQLNF